MANYNGMRPGKGHFHSVKSDCETLKNGTYENCSPTELFYKTLFLQHKSTLIQDYNCPMAVQTLLSSFLFPFSSFVFRLSLFLFPQTPCVFILQGQCAGLSTRGRMRQNKRLWSFLLVIKMCCASEGSLGSAHVSSLKVLAKKAWYCTHGKLLLQYVP